MTNQPIDRGTLDARTGEGEALYRGYTLRYNASGWLDCLRHGEVVDEFTNMTMATYVIDGWMAAR